MLLALSFSRGRFAGENHFDSAPGNMLDTRERTLLMIELLGSSSILLSLLVLSAAPLAAAVAAIGEGDGGLPSPLLVLDRAWNIVCEGISLPASGKGFTEYTIAITP